ncbi:MAG: hypothetical protein KC731_40180 [Myxococcales bacterium]|nr:hypothetical protein [Myxococcales bacterium]
MRVRFGEEGSEGAHEADVDADELLANIATVANPTSVAAGRALVEAVMKSLEVGDLVGAEAAARALLEYVTRLKETEPEVDAIPVGRDM